MRYSHEFGDHKTTKDSMVSSLEVSDHKVDVVGMEVVCCAELYG
jgi:hypothetical protein